MMPKILSFGAGGSEGVTDHGLLTGLTDDDHTGYGRLAGRDGGQTYVGGTLTGQNLKFVSNATFDGKLLFGNVATSFYDEANDRWTLSKSINVLGMTEGFPSLFGGSFIAELSGVTISANDPGVLTKDETIDDGLAEGDLVIVVSGTNAIVGLYRVSSIETNTSVTLNVEAASDTCTDAVVRYYRDVLSISPISGDDHGIWINSWTRNSCSIQIGGNSRFAFSGRPGLFLPSGTYLSFGDSDTNGGMIYGNSESLVLTNDDGGAGIVIGEDLHVDPLENETSFGATKRWGGAFFTYVNVMGMTSTTPTMIGGSLIASLTGVSISNANPSVMTLDATIDDGVAVGDLVIVVSGTNATTGQYRVASIIANTSVTLDRQAVTGSCTDAVISYYKDVVTISPTDGTNGQMITSWSHQNRPLQIGGQVPITLGATVMGYLGNESVIIGSTRVGGGLGMTDGQFIWWDSAATNNQHTHITGSGLVLYLRGKGITFGTDTSISRWQIDTAGHFIGATDNTYDIGATGATRPRTLYLGTSLVTPSVVTGQTIVNGATALSLSAVQVSATIISNTGQGVNDVNHTLPTAAAGYYFRVIIGETQGANYFRFTRSGSDTIIADGVTGKTYINEASPTQGDQLDVYTLQCASTGIKTGAALAMGSTKDRVANGAFTFDAAGAGYAKAADAVGTELNAITTPQNKYGAQALDIGADGTIDPISCTNIATGFDTPGEAVTDLPAAAANHARMGYVTAMNSAAGGFIWGTTEFDVATVTEAFTSSTAYTKPYCWIAHTIRGTWATD